MWTLFLRLRTCCLSLLSCVRQDQRATLVPGLLTMARFCSSQGLARTEPWLSAWAHVNDGAHNGLQLVPTLHGQLLGLSAGPADRHSHTLAEGDNHTILHGLRIRRGRLWLRKPAAAPKLGQDALVDFLQLLGCFFVRARHRVGQRVVSLVPARAPQQLRELFAGALSGQAAITQVAPRARFAACQEAVAWRYLRRRLLHAPRELPGRGKGPADGGPHKLQAGWLEV
mmetsp:Transcript_99000/g.280395  ORF Transcript_99000/g.280395 Transcript_99000/m.280395 type:complete len:227 (+) Transcript_99000:1175-1855(+)